MTEEPHRDENKPGQHREALPTTRATAHVVDEGRLGEGGHEAARDPAGDRRR